jgi:hypothetical protein
MLLQRSGGDLGVAGCRCFDFCGVMSWGVCLSLSVHDLLQVSYMCTILFCHLSFSLAQLDFLVC